MDEMGIEELQRASLGPLRWRRLVQKHAVLVRDLEDAVPLPVKQSSDELWPYWMALSLVPGGRFLAMINGNRDFRRLEMWDLGLPGQGPQPNPVLLAFTEYYALSECYELFVCPDGDSLTIATSHIPLKDGQKAQLCVVLLTQSVENGSLIMFRFEVFSFAPSAISPEFVKLASHRLTLTDEVETSVVGKRALFMQSNSSCILCDFERSLFVHWRFEPTSAAFVSHPNLAILFNPLMAAGVSSGRSPTNLPDSRSCFCLGSDGGICMEAVKPRAALATDAKRSAGRHDDSSEHSTRSHRAVSWANDRRHPREVYSFIQCTRSGQRPLDNIRYLRGAIVSATSQPLRYIRS